jgi:hypothetical protein
MVSPPMLTTAAVSTLNVRFIHFLRSCGPEHQRPSTTQRAFHRTWQLCARQSPVSSLNGQSHRPVTTERVNRRHYLNGAEQRCSCCYDREFRRHEGLPQAAVPHSNPPGDKKALPDRRPRKRPAGLSNFNHKPQPILTPTLAQSSCMRRRDPSRFRRSS